MKRLLKLFTETHPRLASKKVLIVDDEADLASIRFSKNRDTQTIEQGRIADKIDELRRELSSPAVLQVTATPYALYLQPDEYEAQDGANFTFEPKKPAFTQLVPIHSGYVGGDQYFGDHDASEPESYLYQEVHPEELLTLKKEDRRRIRVGETLTSDKVEVLRRALMTFVAAACIRRIQQQKNNQPVRRYAMIVHIETSKSAHAWQHVIVDEIMEAIREGMKKRDATIVELIGEAIDDLERSVAAAKLEMPTKREITLDVCKAFLKGGVVTEKVNSDSQVEALLDDNAELKLRTPFNVFIGGQILDRGITVPNLISFYYGRSPKRMQQDTVLQHARMYGNRNRNDLAVTRFFTTAHNFVALKSIHEFDTALRYAFENNAHDRGVIFIQRDVSNRIIPCAPSKIVVSDVVALRPGSGHLPFGFQTKNKSTVRPIIEQIDRLLPSAAIDSDNFTRVNTETVIEILKLAERTLEFEEGYSFDWEGCRAAIEYYSKIAAPDADKGWCWVLGKTDRDITQRRSGGRYSNAPETYQDRALVKNVQGSLPIVLLLKQNGKEDNGWKGQPFWWPIIFPPPKSKPIIFTASTLSDSEEDDDSEDFQPEVDGNHPSI